MYEAIIPGMVKRRNHLVLYLPCFGANYCDVRSSVERHTGLYEWHDSQREWNQLLCQFLESEPDSGNQ